VANFDVRINDSDPDGDPLAVTGVSEINANGTLKYLVNTDYTGPDSFTYTLSDGKGSTAQATVLIDVISQVSLNVGITNVASGKAYKVIDGGFKVGALLYVDRSYTVKSLPSALANATYIETANGDKARADPIFLTLSINQDASVYIAYDNRATTQPNWMFNWTSTGNLLQTTDVPLKIFKNDFPSGEFTLGGNNAAGASGAGSNYIVILVGKGSTAPTNQPPTVNAGPDQTITLPATASLSGTASDDGLPTGTITFAWSQISGPAQANFSNFAIHDPTVTFSQSGTYEL